MVTAVTHLTAAVSCGLGSGGYSPNGGGQLGWVLAAVTHLTAAGSLGSADPGVGRENGDAFFQIPAPNFPAALPLLPAMSPARIYLRGKHSSWKIFFSLSSHSPRRDLRPNISTGAFSTLGPFTATQPATTAFSSMQDKICT